MWSMCTMCGFSDYHGKDVAAITRVPGTVAKIQGKDKILSPYFNKVAEG